VNRRSPNKRGSLYQSSHKSNVRSVAFTLYQPVAASGNTRAPELSDLPGHSETENGFEAATTTRLVTCPAHSALAVGVWKHIRNPKATKSRHNTSARDS
jgi:hypothetical protein